MCFDLTVLETSFFLLFFFIGNLKFLNLRYRIKQFFVIFFVSHFHLVPLFVLTAESFVEIGEEGFSLVEITDDCARFAES